MARYRLTIEATSITSLRAKLKKLGLSEEKQVEKIELSSSRADRLSEAEKKFENVKSTVTELKDEMQNWLDGMPESLQQGSTADEVRECIDQLEEIEQNLESCDFSSVSFPGMY